MTFKDIEIDQSFKFNGDTYQKTKRNVVNKIPSNCTKRVYRGAYSGRHFLRDSSTVRVLG